MGRLTDYIVSPASVVRCSPGEDRTNGFFVSCFILNGTDTPKRGDQKRKRDDIDGKVEGGIILGATSAQTSTSGSGKKKKRKHKVKKETA